MFLYSPNLWLVLAAAIVSILIGVVWYAKPVFGRRWVELTGRSMESGSQAETRRSMIIMAVATLVEAYVAAHFVYYVGAYSWLEGVQAGLWIWLGFVATTMAVNSVFAGRPAKLWLIDSGYQLVSLMVMGAIFARW